MKIQNLYDGVLGFRVEGVDISFYSNDDYPEGEIAVFMKRRLCTIG